MFDNREKIDQLIKTTEKLNQMNDLDSLLDGILSETRSFTNADAGSIFLKEGDQLRFSYVQNDTLAKRDMQNNRHIYSNFSMPINDYSIAGYVTLSGQPLNIADVYHIESGVPYKFNKDFDAITGYRSKSILTVPMINHGNRVIGVMQIINATDETNTSIPFSKEDEKYVSFFANNASIGIEKAKMTREIILRMIKMAELRDPKETGSHVNRVGAYAIEIYERWAKNRNIPPGDIKKFKDILRIAAMLHDVGKVAISDTILKKPAKLTDEEYSIMKGHTGHGYHLFSDSLSELDRLAAEIAYCHHEKWDGSGYPRQLKGEDIPIAARITSVADVYDALVSERSYKKPWPEEKVLSFFRERAGKDFDPELVDIFLSINDIIKAIRKKYPE